MPLSLIDMAWPLSRRTSKNEFTEVIAWVLHVLGSLGLSAHELGYGNIWLHYTIGGQQGDNAWNYVTENQKDHDVQHGLENDKGDKADERDSIEIFWN